MDWFDLSVELLNLLGDLAQIKAVAILGDIRNKNNFVLVSINIYPCKEWLAIDFAASSFDCG